MRSSTDLIRDFVAALRSNGCLLPNHTDRQYEIELDAWLAGKPVYDEPETAYKTTTVTDTAFGQGKERNEQNSYS